jgi:hypothetical protein
MRAWLIAVGLVAALASTGCMFPVCGPTTWKEPDAPAWLAGNGAAAGFERFAGYPSLPAGPRLAAAMPEGAELRSVTFGEVEGNDVLFLSVYPGNLSVSQNGARKVATATMAEFVREALDRVHRGEPAYKAAVVERFVEAWDAAPTSRDSSTAVFLEVAGPWAFDGEFTRGARFTRDSIGSYYAYAGDDGPFGDGKTWTFMAEVGSWWRFADGGAEIGVDDLGNAQAGVGLLSGGAVKDYVRQAAPGFEWRFEAFHYGGRCPGMG